MTSAEAVTWPCAQDNVTMVFESELDYRSFALKIDEGDLDSLSERIRSLSPRAIRRLQAGIARCACLPPLAYIVVT